MSDVLRMRLGDVPTMVDPTTGSGDVALFPDAMGQGGHPFIMHVADPPHKQRPRHHHHADVLYVYTDGELHIEGEGVYRAGDLRWTRAGHPYGPETTGPQGGAWWVITQGNPLPVNHDDEQSAVIPPQGPPPMAAEGLPRFRAPYDLPRIAAVVRDHGGVILEGFVDPALLDCLDSEIDSHLREHPGAGVPRSGSAGYDVFLGHRTVRLHGLVAKAPSSQDLIADERLLQLSKDIIGSRASSLLLNAGELIQIGPGEPAQFLHRDTDSWPEVEITAEPLVVNAILALDPFTLENGATYLAPGSQTWPRERTASQVDLSRAVMDRGDILLFRADLIHGGGENTSKAARRAISVSYCAGWVRPVENSHLNIPIEVARTLSRPMQDLLGFAPHDATGRFGGMLGLFENGHPRRALETAR